MLLRHSNRLSPSFLTAFTSIACILILGWMLGMPAQANAQSRNDRKLYQKGQQFQSRQFFEKAAKCYEKYLQGHSDWEAKWNLAYCYGRLGRVDDQERMLTDLVFSHPNEAEFKLRLAELLKRQGKYATAKIWYEKYASQSADSAEGKRLAARCGAAEDMQKDSLGYQVAPCAAMNTALDELVPYVQTSQLHFLSNREGAPALFSASRANDGALGKPATARKSVEADAGGLMKGVNMSVRKSAVAAAPLRGGSRADSLRAGQGNLAATLSVEHLCVSPNGKLKVMALSSHGGYGGTDLFVSYFEQGSWSEPLNMGEIVNSAWNEEFPIFTNDSICYFSSDRPEGMGGYDIYSAERIAERWINLRHEGAPLNSSYNEVGFSMVPGQPLGYFASDRKGGMGGYDLYQFRRFKILEGQVVDGLTYLPLRGAKVDIADINQQHHTYFTDAEGRFRHPMRAGQDVFVQAFHPDHHDLNQNISTRIVGYDQNFSVTLPLEPIIRNRMEGIVRDAITKQPLEGVTVRIIGGKDLRTFTNKKGGFEQDLLPSTYYRGIFYLQGYVPEIIEFTTENDAQPVPLRRDIALRKGGFHYLEGRAVDTERDIVVGDATIHFLDGATQKEIYTQNVGPDGMFYKVLEADRDYMVVASKGKYLSARVDVPRATDRADTLLKDMALVPLMPDKVIKTVYFPYRSSTIDAAGMKEVAEVVYLLKSNPNMGLELSAHTDARGGAAYNKTLSQQRANALADYIAAQGVERSRIVAIGMGEERPFNNCTEGVTCSEELHQQNRRAEIKLVRLDR